jgi:valyl-tRNA synthetase
VLVTGYDINTFWVSRMMMMGLRFMDEVPFHAVLNHGLVRDKHGKKMSKSFGNVIDPLELIDAYGADALRFALLRAAAPGRDVPMAEEWVEGARRFANKLWNAARFVLMQLSADMRIDPPGDDGLQIEDRWILSRLEATRAEVDEAYAAYDLSTVAKTLYHFIWDEYCDWYLELAKLRPDASAQHVLAHVLDQALRLLHPVMPFVTEEIWQALHAPSSTAGGDPALMVSDWATPSPQRRDPDAESQFGALQEAVTELRRFRADHGLAPARTIDVVAITDPDRRAVLEAGVDGIRRLAGVEGWTFDGSADAIDGPVGKVPVTGAELVVPLTGVIDLDEERDRLQRELTKALGEKERAERKLANAGFVEKAPEAVVQAERDKITEWTAAITALQAQLAELG